MTEDINYKVLYEAALKDLFNYKEMFDISFKENQGLRERTKDAEIKANAAYAGVKSAHRGIMRLHRKLRTRDEYVSAAENWFAVMFPGSETSSISEHKMDALQKDMAEQRMRMGFIKRPRKEDQYQREVIDRPKKEEEGNE